MQLSQIGRPPSISPSPEIFYDKNYDVNKDPRVIEQRSQQNDDLISQGARSEMTIPQNDQFLSIENINREFGSRKIINNLGIVDDTISQRSAPRSMQYERIGMRSHSMDPTSSLYVPKREMNNTSNTINGKIPERHQPKMGSLVEVDEAGDAQDEYERSKNASRFK